MLPHIQSIFCQNSLTRDLIFLYALLKILKSIDVELKKIRKLFFPSTISLWNSIDLDVRNSTSIDNFKAKITNLSHSFHYEKPLFLYKIKVKIPCALNDYLYLISCCNSPFCVYGLERETAKHYLSVCPRFAA